MSDTSEADRPGGAPRSAYVSRRFLMVHVDAIEQLGSWDAAGTFQRLAWRCERTGSWKATTAEIAAECHLSERTVRRVLKHLRDLGWVQAERASVWDPTLVWRVCWEDENTDDENTDKLGRKRDGQFGHHVTANLATRVTANLATTPSTRDIPPPALRRPGHEPIESIGQGEPDPDRLAQLRAKVRSRP